MQRWGNRLQSILLVTALGLMMALLGLWVAGPTGLLVITLPLVMFLDLGPRIAPAWIMRLYRAQPIPRPSAPRLYEIIDFLSRRAGLQRPPSVYHIPSSILNAFAIGSDRQSAIGVTSAMLRQFSTRELAAVFAHEISHIANRDLHVMGLADLLSRTTQMLANLGFLLLFLKLPLILLGLDVGVPFPAILLLLFAPALSALLQLGLSRTREFQADLNAARLTGDPRGLVLALQRMESAQESLFSRLLNRVQKRLEPSLLRTHPETEERIRRLLELENASNAFGRPEAPAPYPYQVTNVWDLLQGSFPPPRPPRRYLSGLFY